MIKFEPLAFLHSPNEAYLLKYKMNTVEEAFQERKVALITGTFYYKKSLFPTGITGQDGSYLAELLLDKGYHVHGIIRRSSSFNTGRIEHLYADLHDRTFCTRNALMMQVLAWCCIMVT